MNVSVRMDVNSDAGPGHAWRFSAGPSKAWRRSATHRCARRGYYAVTDAVADQAAHQETRRRWRCLLLSIKSKLEVSATGIESFDEAFLANIVTSDNMTVWERMKAESSGILLLEAAK